MMEQVRIKCDFCNKKRMILRYNGAAMMTKEPKSGVCRSETTIDAAV
jgi:hypothetical protein